MKPLENQVALVAGATRGAGRAIAIELAAAGAFTYVTGRSTRAAQSIMARPETIEETAELIAALGGRAAPVRVDHTEPADVKSLLARVEAEHAGRLDILVNDAWGGDPFAQWGVPFWEHDLENGLSLVRNAVESHVITSWYAAPLMRRRRGGLIVEVTDGVTDRYRGSLFYDLAKSAVNRLALAQAKELRPDNVAVVALSPGFLRSEAMLDHFGVTEANWRDAAASDPDFAYSETPHYIGRAVAALAADANVMSKTGRALATWNLAKEYGFTDVDGTQPDWGKHAREARGLDVG